VKLRLPASWKGWVGAAGVLVAIALAFVVGTLVSSRDGAPSASESATTSSSAPTSTLPEIDLEVRVDTSIEPGVATVPPLEEGGDPRPVGRLVTEDGTSSDFVIGEFVVVVPNQEAIDELRRRPDVEVVDVDDDPDAAPEDGIDVLVKAVDIDSVDSSTAAWALDEIDPELSGVLTVDSEQTAATPVILSRLWNETDYDFILNHVPTFHDVDDGQLLEAMQDELNAFEWPFVQSTAAQEIGLDTAWQMLYHHNKTQNRVTVLVIDKGFVRNGDFPENARIRKGDWGPDENWLCTNDTPCPYHGTQVALTIAGQHDNLWGTAGVAAPFVHLVVMPAQGSTYDTLKQAKKVIKEENVDIVNMSYGSVATVRPGLTQWYNDRTFRLMRERHGTVAFASAGNEGINVDATSELYLPCASDEVICVGGMGVDTTEKHDGSNYGTQSDNRSVEIYGPFCTFGYIDPSDTTTGDVKQICGTSFSSPFVAGVAALLRVADPDISPGEIKDILYSTAHIGDLGPLATGHRRRIDAHMAVAAALGVTWTPPMVTIEAGGGSYPVDEVISFSGSATSYTGESVPLRWHSSIDGWLNDFPSMTPVGAVLSSGEHLIQATAIDRRGLSSVAAVNVTIENEPPVVTIVNPSDGATIYEGTALNMVAYTHDPDPFINEALAEESVIWTISDQATGSTVWESDGHVLVTALNPGDYTITLSGTDQHGASETDSVEITVLELEPGWQPPVATIMEPANDSSLGVSNNDVTVDLRGRARGVDGGLLSGTGFRWTATSDTGHVIEICTGSGVPGQGSGGGFTIPVDCEETSVDLGLAPGAVGRTVWAVKLEAFYPQSSVPVEAIRHIEVTFAAS
jgi:hypothetical protein